jgi:predicted small integral membrane protein
MTESVPLLLYLNGLVHHHAKKTDLYMRRGLASAQIDKKKSEHMTETVSIELLWEVHCQHICGPKILVWQGHVWTGALDRSWFDRHV